MYIFGSGVLLGHRNDITVATPINFGLVQEVTLDIAAEEKELYGQYQFPVAIGRGKAKFTGKAKMAKISAFAFGNLFFGVAPSTGQLAAVIDEAASVPAVTSYTITVANAATFSEDFGVVYAATGLPFEQVAAGSEATGKYSVSSSGVYTFDATDASAAVKISYNYTVAGSGEQIAVTNPLLGSAPTFSAALRGLDPTTGLALNVYLYKCLSNKLTMATKLDDFMMPELDFGIFANAANDVMNVSLAQAD